MTTPNATPACADAPHAPPEHVATALPPILANENLSKAIGAAWADCEQCMKRHREIAHDINATPVVMLMLSVAMIWTAINVHGTAETPPDTAYKLLGQLMPGAHDYIEGPTLRVLQSIPLKQVPGPDGSMIATWEPQDVLALIDRLPGEERAAVWTDTVTFLHGVLRGERRARAEGKAWS